MSNLLVGVLVLNTAYILVKILNHYRTPKKDRCFQLLLIDCLFCLPSGMFVLLVGVIMIIDKQIKDIDDEYFKNKLDVGDENIEASNVNVITDDLLSSVKDLNTRMVTIQDNIEDVINRQSDDPNAVMLQEIKDEIVNMSNDEFVADYNRLCRNLNDIKLKNFKDGR